MSVMVNEIVNVTLDKQAELEVAYKRINKAHAELVAAIKALNEIEPKIVVSNP